MNVKMKPDDLVEISDLEKGCVAKSIIGQTEKRMILWSNGSNGAKYQKLKIRQKVL